MSHSVLVVWKVQHGHFRDATFFVDLGLVDQIINLILSQDQTQFCAFGVLVRLWYMH